MAASKKSETIIVLPGIEFRTMEIKIIGETPLDELAEIEVSA
jgi:hypothetical protein